MIKKLLISLLVFACFVAGGVELALLTDKSANFVENDSGKAIFINSHYNLFQGTATFTVRIENVFETNKLLEIFDPVIYKVVEMDKNHQKIVEISLHYNDFIKYRDYYEAKKVIPISRNQYKDIFLVTIGE